MALIENSIPPFLLKQDVAVSCKSFISGDQDMP